MAMSFDGRLLSGVGVLAAVVESGSFVGAAGILGMTQSGISRAVARLEQRVGVRLFERNARAVTLTDEGRRFYERAAPLFSELDEAVMDVGRSATAVRGSLRVSVNPLVLRIFLAPRLTGFLAAHPDLSLSVDARDDPGELVAEGFDVAVRFGEPARSGHIVRRLVDTRVVTCASPGYLARRGHPRRPRDLTVHECVHYIDPATGRPFVWEFHRKGRVEKVPVTGRLTLNDGATMLILCEEGHGIAQTLEFAAAGLRDGRLVDIFPDWNGERFPLYLQFPSRRQQPAKVRAFVDFVAATVR
jgi:DNA-binding transcriptional LysR family regulator